ncbi:MAG: DUF2155 domain-containing protein [Mariprofundaceae bacterium]
MILTGSSTFFKPLRSAMISALILCGFFSLVGCNQDAKEEISWQLPLHVPNDPHATTTQVAPPEWLEVGSGIATFTFLDIHTANSLHIEIKQGGEWSYKSLRLRLVGLAQGLRVKNGAYINDENVYNPAAFMEVTDHKGVIFSGWIYQQFPELFGLDASRWKLWLKSVSVRPSSREPSSARSSAG